MATYSWSVPTGNIITGNTYIKDTDNKIQDTMDDLADFVNSSGAYTGQGLLFDYVNKANNQTITGVKTFSNGLIGNVTGNVTGTVSGNSGTATKLATARTITLAGDVTGSLSFDGSANTSMTATIADNSHSHTIANVTGLETALDGKLSTSGNATTATKWTTSRSITLSGDVTGTVSGVDGSSNISIATSFALAKIVTGMIIMWSGSQASIPSGWLLCNGLNGTPNLIDRFIIGAGNTYGVGATGGSKDAIVVAHTHSGSTSSDGLHNHSSDVPLGYYANSGNGYGGLFGSSPTTQRYTNYAGAHSHSLNINGSGESGIDKNLPPYYALCFIMKA